MLPTSPRRTCSLGCVVHVHTPHSHSPRRVTLTLILLALGWQMADHYKWKKGKVNEEYARRYQTYLARLHHLTTLKGSALEGAQLISLTRRHGFAHAVRRGVLRVRTPFVVIAQHDRTVIRPVRASAYPTLAPAIAQSLRGSKAARRS